MGRGANVLVSMYECPCGVEHAAVGRVGHLPVIECAAARPGLHFYPTMSALVSGPEPELIVVHPEEPTKKR